MIISRYLAREVTLTLSTVTGILLLTFLSNQFARFLGKAAGGTFASNLLMRLFVVEIPHLLSILLPLGLFLGIMLAYGRLYADNEMTVMNVGGLSRAKLIKYTLPVTGIIAAIMAILCFWVNPYLIAYRNNLLAQTGTAVEVQLIAPGRFQSFSSGQRVFYVEKVSPDRQNMYNIFVAQVADKASSTNPAIVPWSILTANSGYQTINPKNGDRFFVTTHGQRYSGTPGQNDFQIMQYEKYALRIESHVVSNTKETEAMSTSDLWHATQNRAAAMGELQWRFSLPFSALLLTLLAIPLSHVQPRHSRYTQLLPAILIYVCYGDLLLIARNAVQHGTISSALGLWWVHGLLLIIISIAWIREIGWKRSKQFWQKLL